MRVAAFFILVLLSACARGDEQPSAEPAPAGRESVLGADARTVIADPADAGREMKVSAPAARARLTSPFTVEGEAPGSWYFEAVFPITLVSEDGTVLAEAPGQALDDWMTPGPVRFKATILFAVPAETRGWLVLARDNPSGEPERAGEVRIPVTLTPAS